MHLGDPDVAGDLGLGQAAEEPQHQDRLAADGQLGDERFERLPELDHFQRRVVAAENALEAGPAARARLLKPAGSSSDKQCPACCTCSPSMTSSTSIPSRAAISEGRGARPRRWPRSATAW